MFRSMVNSMLNIYITRHGQNVDNVAGILNGRRDLPLTDLGLKQAEKLAGKIKETGITFDAIYSSPLKRAFDTAMIITDVIDTSKPEPEPLLIERDFGVMTGQKISDIEELCSPNIFKAEVITYFLDAEGAETFPELLQRSRKLLDKLQRNHSTGNILFVTHGDIGKMIYAEYYHLDWKQTLSQFHFGNCDLLLLSPTSPSQEAHVFKFEQHNH